MGVILRDVITGSANFPRGAGKAKGPAGRKDWMKGPTMVQYNNDSDPFREATTDRKREETQATNPPNERRDGKKPQLNIPARQDSGKRSHQTIKCRWEDWEKLQRAWNKYCTLPEEPEDKSSETDISEHNHHRRRHSSHHKYAL